MAGIGGGQVRPLPRANGQESATRLAQGLQGLISGAAVEAVAGEHPAVAPADDELSGMPAEDARCRHRVNRIANGAPGVRSHRRAVERDGTAAIGVGAAVRDHGPRGATSGFEGDDLVPGGATQGGCCPGATAVVGGVDVRSEGPAVVVVGETDASHLGGDAGADLGTLGLNRRLGSGDPLPGLAAIAGAQDGCARRAGARRVAEDPAMVGAGKAHRHRHEAGGDRPVGWSCRACGSRRRVGGGRCGRCGADVGGGEGATVPAAVVGAAVVDGLVVEPV